MEYRRKKITQDNVNDFWKYKEVYSMGMITVYHGGYQPVEKPEIRVGRNTKDFKYPTHQMVFCTQEALEHLKYRGYEEVLQ